MLEANNENKVFRRMFAFCHAGIANLYCDDGELQDLSKKPYIDWKRDSFSEIQQKLLERANNDPKVQEFLRNLK